MSAPLIKLCGLMRPEDAEAAVAAGADFVGVVFASESRRRRTVEQARRIVAAVESAAGSRRQHPRPDLLLPHGSGHLWFNRCRTGIEQLLPAHRPLVVGVFADQPVSLVNAISEAVGLDLIQLSGYERWDDALACHRPVIKAVRIEPDDDGTFAAADIEPGTASLLLVDAFVPGAVGGTGRLANWDAAARVASQFPIMLAGGLTPENVPLAVHRVRPWAVDVSSGIERDGHKDPELMRSFAAAVCGAVRA